MAARAVTELLREWFRPSGAASRRVASIVRANVVPNTTQALTRRTGRADFRGTDDEQWFNLQAAAGLYDPRFEHDSCGVSFVANIKGAASHELVLTGLRALTNLAHRGATGAEADTGDGAGILTQIPDRFLRGVFADQGIELPPPGRYAVGTAFLPTDADAVDKAKAAIEDIVVEQGLAVVGWRDVPIVPACLGATARAAMPSFQQLVVTDADSGRASAGIELDRLVLRRPQARRARAGAGPGDLLPVPVGAHPRVQGDVHHAPARRVLPRPRRRALRERHRAGAQPLLDQHLPVVAARPPVPLRRPQRRDQHGAGQRELDARPRGDARQSAPRRARAGVPDLHAGRVRHRPLRRGARAARPRRAPAAPRRADDDPPGVGERRHHGPGGAGVLPLPRRADGAVGRAGERRLHRRHRDRRRARPQRPAPEPLLGHRRRHRGDGVGGGRDRRRPGPRGAQGPAPARADVPHRHRRRAHRRRRRDQAGAGRRAPLRRVARRGSRRVRRAARPRAPGVQPRQRAAPPAAVRLHPRRAQDHRRPDGAVGGRAARLDGHRHAARRAVGSSAPAVRLLRPAVRPGHQPAARRDPRGDRHVGGVDGRPGGEPAAGGPGELPPARPAVPDHRQRRVGQDRPRQQRRRLPRAAGPPGEGSVPRRRRRPGARAGAHGDLRRGVGGHRGRRSRDRALGPQQRPRRGADPVVAADRGRAPPPRAHEAAHDGRPDRRVRRRTRGAPHGAADRLRRRGGQPVPGVRVDRGHGRRRRRPRGQRPGRDRPREGGSQLHQGVRQGRAQGDVEDGRVDGGELHRRPDLRGDRARRRARRPVLHRHGQPSRRHRARAGRPRGGGPPRHRPPEAPRGARPPPSGTGRRVPVASRGRAPPVQPDDGVQAAARHAGQALRHLQGVLGRRQRPVEAAGHAARPVRAEGRRA